MKQRGFVIPGLMSILPYIIGGVLVAALAGWLWWRADHWCNAACQTQTDIAQAAILRVGVLEEAIAVAQKRATDLALLWSAAVQRVEQRHEVAQQKRVMRYAGVRERAGAIKPATDRVVVRVPDAAVRVLDDAYRASGGEAAAPAPVSDGAGQAVPEAADSTLTEWITFAVDASESYRDAVDKLNACVSWANAITTAQATAQE